MYFSSLKPNSQVPSASIVFDRYDGTLQILKGPTKGRRQYTRASEAGNGGDRL